MLKMFKRGWALLLNLALIMTTLLEMPIMKIHLLIHRQIDRLLLL